MFVNKKALKDLIEQEHASSIQEFGVFGSAHEGYAIMLEELEELTDALACVTSAAETLWHCIKTNQLAKHPDADLVLGMLQQNTANLCEEAIQTAAMAVKFKAWHKAMYE